MIERIARALAGLRYASIGGPDSEALGKPAWVYCVPDALQAVEAMREPTEEMLFAADWLENGTYAAWQAMIDSILSQPQEEKVK